MSSEKKRKSYNLLEASVVEAVNDAVIQTNEHHKPGARYTKKYLVSLCKSELIDIILKLQNQRELHRKSVVISNQYRSKSVPSPPLSSAAPKYHHPHQKVVKNMKSTERMATDYQKIEKQREMIKKLKQKKKAEKADDINVLKQRNAHRNNKMYSNPHEKVIKNIKSKEKMGTDYEKIEKQREIIKKLKEKKKLEKLQYENSLKQRNAHRTNNLFADPHEKVVKHKDIKQPKKKKNNNNNKDPQREKIMDIVSREMTERRDKLHDFVDHKPLHVTSESIIDSKGIKKFTQQIQEEANHEMDEQMRSQMEFMKMMGLTTTNDTNNEEKNF